MKYKTLFRLLLKVLGVLFFFTGVTNVLDWVMYIANINAGQSGTWSMYMNLSPRDIVQLAIAAVPVAAGLYLFFGGEWIVNKAIPSNRAYCHECGYMLKNLTGNKCPECDTPFRADPAPTTTPPEGA